MAMTFTDLNNLNINSLVDVISLTEIGRAHV